MPGLKRPTHIYDDEREAHNQSTNGYTFTNEDHPMKIGIMKHVGRQNQHDSCSCNTHKKSEVGNIKTPTDNISHPCNGETVPGLEGISINSNTHTNEQKNPENLKGDTALEIPANGINKKGFEIFTWDCFHVAPLTNPSYKSGFYNTISQ